MGTRHASRVAIREDNVNLFGPIPQACAVNTELGVINAEDHAI